MRQGAGGGAKPRFKPATMREYKPKSTLVTPQQLFPRAKFPVIDIHSHQPTPISNEEFGRVMKGMEANNLRLLVNLSGSSGDRLRKRVHAIKDRPHNHPMRLLAHRPWRSVGPGLDPQ